MRLIKNNASSQWRKFVSSSVFKRSLRKLNLTARDLDAKLVSYWQSELRKLVFSRSWSRAHDYSKETWESPAVRMSFSDFLIDSQAVKPKVTSVEPSLSSDFPLCYMGRRAVSKLTSFCSHNTCRQERLRLGWVDATVAEEGASDLSFF